MLTLNKINEQLLTQRGNGIAVLIISVIIILVVKPGAVMI